MKIAADLHTHTLASGHALNSIREMIAAAAAIGLEGIAITDHGPEMPGGPDLWYLGKAAQMPDIMDDMLVLAGAEANVLDTDGQLDIPERLLEKMDWVIVSPHVQCLEPLPPEEMTQMWLRVAQNPYVDMIGHPEQQIYSFDYHRVAKACAQTHTVVEMNAGSKYSRPGNEDNLRRLALACKEHQTMVAVNTDAHADFELGRETEVLQMLESIDFPEEQVVNSTMKRLLRELDAHHRPIARRVSRCFGARRRKSDP